MTTMRAAVVREFGKPLVIEERPVPEPGAGELLVRVVASGVCHTDLHAANGDWPVKPRLPFVPGHEAAGYVAGVGPGVDGFKEGEPVGVPWLHDACGHCEHCETGWETLCEAQHNTGYSVDGGYAEYVLAKADYVARLPARTDFFAIAPILCAGVTTYKGLKETETMPGEWVAISGIGGLGHVAVQYAKAMGLNVLAIDVNDAKLSLARSAGADAVVNATVGCAVDEVRKIVRGGVHGVLVTAPSVGAFRQGIGMARRHGTVVLVGLPAGEFPISIFDVVLKRITIRGSIVGTRRDLDEAIAFAANGKIHCHHVNRPLAEINQIFKDMAAGQIEGRVVLSI
jgi:propanol-preferring alcohol dehydrogenase